MKTTGLRSAVLYFVLILLIGPLLYLLVNLFVNGETWIAQAYNGHIYASDATVESGDILDSNNLLLLYEEDGEKLYSDDVTIRTALLHTIGDYSGYIGTSIQSRLKSELVGYNFITGLNTLPSNPYIGGQDISLTVDAELCALAYELLDGKNGAVLLSNYETGEILCKVSTPSYDPMNIPSDLLTSDEYEGVFLDNTISSSYTPGSIFKIITAASAIENLEDAEDIVYTCSGTHEFDGGTVTCTGTHGSIDLQEALGCSCNIYFAQLATELGTDNLQQTAEELGFNMSFSYSSFSSKASSISLEDASEIELAWAGVGQYTITANPSHFLLLMHAIANQGEAMSLRLTEKSLIESFTDDTISMMSASTANTLKDLMSGVVSGYYSKAIFNEMDVCAKTGTAEVGGDQDANSWIVGFSDDEETPYAFVVVVEDAGSGMGTAGYIAGELLEYLS